MHLKQMLKVEVTDKLVLQSLEMSVFKLPCTALMKTIEQMY